MRRMTIAATLLGAPLALSGCKSVTEGAREQFSREHTCPLDRVEVRARPEIRASALEERRAPPREVGSDPERLRMWQAEEDKRRAATDGRDDIVEVRGCGHQTLYACRRGSRNQNSVSCWDKPYPAGAARW